MAHQCPSCQAELSEDSPRCPECGEVMDPFLTIQPPKFPSASPGAGKPGGGQPAQPQKGERPVSAPPPKREPRESPPEEPPPPPPKRQSKAPAGRASAGTTATAAEAATPRSAAAFRIAPAYSPCSAIRAAWLLLPASATDSAGPVPGRR